MPRKSPKSKDRRLYTFFYLLLCVLAWWVIWISTQALFIINVPLLSDFLLRSENTTTNFAILTAWICITGLIATFLWSRWSNSNFSFLKTPRWRWIVIGYLPILIATIIITVAREPFGIPGWLWAPSLLVTTFYQDILTFGFLQTAIEKRLRPSTAALLTAFVFFAGHFWLVGNAPSFLDPQVYLFAIGFPVIALLRYKTKTIYATNMLHSAFHMFSGLI